MDELKPHNNTEMSYTPVPHPRRWSWGIIAVVFILLGAGLFAIGWLSGTRGGRIYFDRGIRVETNEETSDLSGGEFYFDSNIHSIEANATTRNIRIIPTSESHVRVVIPYGLRPNITESNGALNIDARSGTTIGGDGIRWQRVQFFGLGHSRGVTWNRFNNTTFLDFNFDFSRSPYSNLGNAIRVYVPHAVDNINVRGTTSSVNVDNISTGQLRVQTTTGRITINGGTHGNSHLQTTTGAINANAHFAEDLYVRATTGRVTVNGEVHGNSRLQTTTGSVNASAYFAGEIYVRATTGRVTVEDNNRERRIGNESIQLRTTTGSITFTTRASINDFRYSVSVSTGSMRVNDNRISGRSASGGTGSTPISASATTGSVRLNFGR